jgi:hypothetical protein
LSIQALRAISISSCFEDSDKDLDRETDRETGINEDMIWVKIKEKFSGEKM